MVWVPYRGGIIKDGVDQGFVAMRLNRSRAAFQVSANKTTGYVGCFMHMLTPKEFRCEFLLLNIWRFLIVLTFDQKVVI